MTDNELNTLRENRRTLDIYEAEIDLRKHTQTVEYWKNHMTLLEGKINHHDSWFKRTQEQYIKKFTELENKRAYLQQRLNIAENKKALITFKLQRLQRNNNDDSDTD
jgi:hypothetical protein